jgi:hypothetical protein
LDRLAPKHIYEPVGQKPEHEYEEVKWFHTFWWPALGLLIESKWRQTKTKFFLQSEAFNFVCFHDYL